MRYSHRFWLYAPLLAFLTLTAIVGAYWWFASNAFDRKLTALNGHAAANGVTITFAGKTLSGFPFNIDAVFTGFQVTGMGAHGPFHWSSEKFALHRLTYGRTQDIYEAAGQQTFGWTDAHGTAHTLKFLPGSLRASAITDAKGLARFDLDMIDAGGSDSDGAPFTAARVQFHLRRDPKADALDLMASGDDIKAKANIAGLFGAHVRNVKVYATLSQGSAFAPVLAGNANLAEAAAAWKRQDGQVAIGPVTIASAGLNLSADTFADQGGDLKALFGPLY